jgi:hypothetical protein
MVQLLESKGVRLLESKEAWDTVKQERALQLKPFRSQESPRPTAARLCHLTPTRPHNPFTPPIEEREKTGEWKKRSNQSKLSKNIQVKSFSSEAAVSHLQSPLAGPASCAQGAHFRCYSPPFSQNFGNQCRCCLFPRTPPTCPCASSAP